MKIAKNLKIEETNFSGMRTKHIAIITNFINFNNFLRYNMYKNIYCNDCIFEINTGCLPAHRRCGGAERT